MTASSERVRWPVGSDVVAWTELANRALQQDTLACDLAENAAWEQTLRALIAQHLTREEFVVAHLAALKERQRRRKLEQQNLRYKYGYREGAKPRPLSLIRLDVRRALKHEPE